MKFAPSAFILLLTLPFTASYMVYNGNGAAVQPPAPPVSGGMRPMNVQVPMNAGQMPTNGGSMVMGGGQMPMGGGSMNGGWSRSGLSGNSMGGGWSGESMNDDWSGGGMSGGPRGSPFAVLFTNLTEIEKTELEACKNSSNYTCFKTWMDERIDAMPNGTLKTQIIEFRANFSLPTAIENIFENLSAADKAMLQSHDYCAIIDWFKNKLNGITDASQKQQAQDWLAHKMTDGPIGKCYGPIIRVVWHMNLQQCNATESMIMHLDFNGVEKEINQVIATLSPQEQNETNQWIEENKPPQALINLLANVKPEDIEAMQGAGPGGSSNFGALTSIFTNITHLPAQDQKDIMTYFAKQMQCMMSCGAGGMGGMGGMGGGMHSMGGSGGAMPLIGGSGSVMQPMGGTGGGVQPGGSRGGVQPVTSIGTGSSGDVRTGGAVQPKPVVGTVISSGGGVRPQTGRNAGRPATGSNPSSMINRPLSNGPAVSSGPVVSGGGSTVMQVNPPVASGATNPNGASGTIVVSSQPTSNSANSASVVRPQTTGGRTNSRGRRAAGSKRSNRRRRAVAAKRK